MNKQLTSDFASNQQLMDEIFHPQLSYDLMLRSFIIAEKPACFYMIDGLNKDDILEKIMDSFLGIKPDTMPPTVQDFSSLMIPYGEVDLIKDSEELTTALLSGVPILIIDGYAQALAIDFRTYPARSIEEPSKEKVLRGSKDGFVETIVFNTALIRRRIRNPDLVMEIASVGKSSRTDIVLSYMQERVDPHFLENIRRRLAEISADALTMNCESLAEAHGEGVRPVGERQSLLRCHRHERLYRIAAASSYQLAHERGCFRPVSAPGGELAAALLPARPPDRS